MTPNERKKMEQMEKDRRFEMILRIVSLVIGAVFTAWGLETQNAAMQGIGFALLGREGIGLAQKAPKAAKAMAPVLLAVLMVGMVGCAGKTVAHSTATAAMADTEAPADVQFLGYDEEGNATWTNVQKFTATSTVADKDGLNQVSAGGHRTLSMSYGDIVLALTDPLDGSLEGLEIVVPPNGEEGMVTIKLAKFESKPSVTIAAYNEQVEALMGVIAEMSDDQKEKFIEALRAGKDIGTAFLEATGKALAPGGLLVP